MWEDPIVAEVHRVREQLAAQYNYDIDAFFADMRKRQEALGDRLVRIKKSAEPTAEADQGRDPVQRPGNPFTLPCGFLSKNAIGNVGGVKAEDGDQSQK